jgi:hypothetical protein
MIGYRPQRAAKHDWQPLHFRFVWVGAYSELLFPRRFD